jgi:nicotinamidase/pyrazinamidase
MPKRKKKQKKRRALLVVDMLKGFLEPEGSLYCGDSAREIIPYVRRRIREYERRGDPVVFTCDRHAPDDPEFEQWEPHCIEGTWGAEIVDALPVPDESLVVAKTTINPFFETRLDEVLAQLEPDTVEVVGVCTNICVLYAAMELRVRTFEVRVPRKGVATFDAEAHEQALQAMENTFGVDVV